MSGETTNKAVKPEFSSRFNVIVKPGSVRSEYCGIDKESRHTVRLKERAVDNQANLGLIRFFKKEFGLRIRIIKGLRSKEKVIEILNI